MAKSTKAGGPTFNSDELNDPSPPPVVQRAMLGGEPQLVGIHSSESSLSEQQLGGIGSHSRQERVQMMENRSGQMEEEDSIAPSTDGDGQSEIVKPYDEWTVAELQEECRNRELPVSGRKDDLIQRLEDDDDMQESDFK